MPREIVNLLVDLSDDRIARAQLEVEGFALEDARELDERRLSWIDLTFGGTWSSEAHSGCAWFALRDGEPVGFAAYGATDLRFYWLQAWRAERDVALFGPSAVIPQFSGSPLGGALRLGALSSLRERGFAQALIPGISDELTISYYQHLCGARVVDRFSLDNLGPASRTTVLASGGGTNFQAVVDAVGSGLRLDVTALVTNCADAFVVERAHRAGIRTLVRPWERNSVTRADYDASLVELVAGTEPELVLLLGWMHVLSPAFVQRFPKMVNIHPAFLPYDGSAETVTFPDGTIVPAFRGPHAIRDALAVQAPWYGATAHRVSVDFDRGAILQRAPLLLERQDEESALAALRPTEHAVLLGAIRRILFER